jgi:hypothetical protein
MNSFLVHHSFLVLGSQVFSQVPAGVENLQADSSTKNLDPIDPPSSPKSSKKDYDFLFSRAFLFDMGEMINYVNVIINFINPRLVVTKSLILYVLLSYKIFNFLTLALTFLL